MAYYVTKQIGRHRYRYEVEGHRDPKTKRVKQRWTYLGRVFEDEVVEAQRARADDSRERIVAAILQLLERGDIEVLTVDVISRAARVSRGTFYRVFRNGKVAIKTAIESVYTELLAVPPRLDEPIASVAVERKRLARWMTALLETVLRRPGVHRALVQSPLLSKLRLERVENNAAETHRSLQHYLERLVAAGLVETDSSERLAIGIMSIGHGFFKRVILDRQERLAQMLIESGVETICRATFGPS